MTTLTIRNFDDSLKQLLRDRAALHGRSMSEEARLIIEEALRDASMGLPFGTLLRRHFAGLGPLDIPPRGR